MGIPQSHVCTVGDTLSPMGVQLVREDGAGGYAVVDLTGLTVKFKMADREGTVVVAETVTGVSIIDATAGKVQYDFQATDVDTEGIFYAWFITYLGSEKSTYPADGRSFSIRVVTAA